MDLFELRDRVSRLPSLENRMADLQDIIRKTEKNVSILLMQYEKESRDLEQIQKSSLSSFLLKLIRKYEDKLEKEQREEINAKLAYDREVTHLNALLSTKNELASRISVLKSEAKTYQSELENKRKEISGKMTEHENIRYAELENERTGIVSQITEIEEALTAAARAKSTAQEIYKSLDSAEGWATVDMFTRGGIISHIAKYSHIDDAEKNFYALSSQLHDLKSELSDVNGLTLSGFTEISSTQRAVDFWFDNIFTDMSVRSQIKDNIEQLRSLLSNIDTAESMLKLKLDEKNKELEKNKNNEEEFILSINK